VRGIRGESVEALITEFRSLAIQQREAMEEGNHRLANRLDDRVMRVYSKLTTRGHTSQAALLALLDDQDPRVRIWAVVYALEVAPDRAETVLEELDHTATGVLGVSAMHALHRLRQRRQQSP
jgi:hypothetical protein